MGCKTLLANNLQILMGRDAVSRQSLAKKLGVRPSSVSRWMAATHWPSAESFDEIGRSFGWSMTELMRSRQSPQQPTEKRPPQTVAESKIIEGLALANVLSSSLIETLKLAKDHLHPHPPGES